MKIFKAILVLASFTATQVAMASDKIGYIGVGAGQTKIVKDVDGSYDVANTLTLTTGLIILESTSFETSVEANYTQTVQKENVTLSGSANEYKEESLGLFVASRTNSDFYAKAKLGFVDTRITTNTVVTYDSVKLSAGIGFGIKDDSGGVTEIEYIVIDDDINMLNVGYLF